MRRLFTKSTAEYLIQKYARFITPSALLFGFIVDNIILQRVDSLFTFTVILFHFGIITVGILLLHATYAAHALSARYIRFMRVALGVIMPFSFGSLFSGFFIFYSKSTGSLLSWLFLAVLMLFMISTEYYKRHYLKIVVQVTLWYFTLVSFLILYVPIAIKQMNAGVFVLSAFFSLFFAAGFFSLLSAVEPVRYAKYAAQIIGNTAAVFCLLILLYFINVIPPIPLALQHGGAYYEVTRAEGSYILTTQHHPWYSWERYTNATLYKTPSNAISLFSAVFAPARLSPELYHEWQYKDAAEGWVTASTIPFPIIGGREQGYRGYTTKENVVPGAWRVRIITEQRQVVGVVRFNIVEAASTPELSREIW
jgi:hypothetical protein